MKFPQFFTTITPFSKILAMILFITFPFIGFLLGMKYQKLVDLSNQSIISSTKVVTIVITPTPILTTGKETSCEVDDKDFCGLFDKIYPLVLSLNYSELIKFQDLVNFTCDVQTGPILSPTICNGARKGEIKQGYLIATNKSEESINTKEQAISVLTNYPNSYQLKWQYYGSVIEAKKSVMIFLDAQKKNLLVLEIKKETPEWRIKNIVIGIATNDYITLDKIVLNYF